MARARSSSRRPRPGSLTSGGRPSGGQAHEQGRHGPRRRRLPAQRRGRPQRAHRPQDARLGSTCVRGGPLPVRRAAARDAAHALPAHDQPRRRRARSGRTLESSRNPLVPGSVELALTRTAEDEARAVADRISELLQDGHQAGDIAVLYRSVRTSAQPLVKELRSRRIRFAVVGKTSLLARPEMALVARVLSLEGT